MVSYPVVASGSNVVAFALVVCCTGFVAPALFPAWEFGGDQRRGGAAGAAHSATATSLVCNRMTEAGMGARGRGPTWANQSLSAVATKCAQAHTPALRVFHPGRPIAP